MPDYVSELEEKELLSNELRDKRNIIGDDMQAIGSEVTVKYADKRRYFETKLIKLKLTEEIELQQRTKSMRESVIELDKDLKMLKEKITSSQKS